ncbi:7TM domain-containing protein [Sphingomicrobium astaxanthinifaciens]|uniref:7TM domain-containing protein n=1 Tax=Sphingomicrobium astaxanthinifaciens TaxID=1227949 RepID=UPI00389B2A53
MPFGTCVVLLTRSILGIDTFGVYTPMLMSLAFIKLGPVLSPIVSGGAVLLAQETPA